jgi:hypothetical protein
MADLFKEIIPSILITGKPVDTDSVNTYMINRALSYHYDCVLHANQMNLLSHTDKKLQYTYLLNTIRKYKRPYSKWHKREVPENIEVVKEYYDVSDAKAKEMLAILTPSQILELTARLEKGGVKK